MDNKRSISYINGMKGIACFMIMLSHYFYIYAGAESFVPAIKVLDVIKTHAKLSIFFDEQFWVSMFFVVSGYLAAMADIRSLPKLLKKILRRFLRLFIPVLLTFAVIYIIYLTVGFHNAETKQFFDSSWYQNYYSGSISFSDVLLGPFRVLLLGDHVMNGPYWVLRGMLLASMAVYAFNYIIHRFPNKYVQYILAAVLLMSSSFFDEPYRGCIFGFLVYCFENRTDETKEYYFAFIALLAFFAYAFSRKVEAFAAFGLIILLAKRSSMLDRFLSCKLFLAMGKVSWGIYSFHWPVVCSVGGLLICVFAKKSLTAAYFVAAIVCVIVTALLAIFSKVTIERVTSKLINISFFKG